MSQSLEYHLTVDEDCIAVDFLANKTSLSKQKIKAAMLKGCLWQSKGSKTQRLRRAKKNLKKGEEIHLYYDEHVLSRTPTAPILIHDAKEYSVWNKPSGLLSQGSKWGDHCTVTRWAEQHLKPQRNAFVVHRLDRAATGLILVAHSKSAAAKLSQLFQNRKIEKRYLAEVDGIWLNKEPITISTAIDDKQAISHVILKSVNEIKHSSYVYIDIETGRKHQIRKHLSSINFPIIGDRLHGNATTNDHENPTVDLRLKAIELRFQCPITSQEVAFVLNADFNDFNTKA